MLRDGNGCLREIHNVSIELLGKPRKLYFMTLSCSGPGFVSIAGNHMVFSIYRYLFCCCGCRTENNKMAALRTVGYLTVYTYLPMWVIFSCTGEALCMVNELCNMLLPYDLL